MAACLLAIRSGLCTRPANASAILRRVESESARPRHSCLPCMARDRFRRDSAGLAGFLSGAFLYACLQPTLQKERGGENRPEKLTPHCRQVACLILYIYRWLTAKYTTNGCRMRVIINRSEVPEHLRAYFKPVGRCGACFVCHLVEVFRAVRRVLRSDGTCWLNIGDSYAGSGKGPTGHNGIGDQSERQGFVGDRRKGRGIRSGTGYELRDAPSVPGLKPKDLMLIPERLALALQADGWWVRSRIIWCKRAPMPESIRDRPTSATEHIFLLTKSRSYFYDATAVRQPYNEDSLSRYDSPMQNTESQNHQPGRERGRENRTMGPNPAGANLRNWWLLGPDPQPEAHFATFPREIPRRAILAGTSAYGACLECGAPWARVVERTNHQNKREPAHVPGNCATKTDSTGWQAVRSATDRWQPTCKHEGATVRPCTVLDPFVGSGTTLLVAEQLGRDSIGIELQPAYVEIAERRLARVTPQLPGLVV